MGMSSNSAIAVARLALKDFEDMSKVHISHFYGPKSVFLLGTNGELLLLEFGEDDLLKSLEMRQAFVDRAFNVKDLPTEAFVQEFADHYGIQKFSPFRRGSLRGWN